MAVLVAMIATPAPVVIAQDEEDRLQEVEQQIESLRNRLEAARSERTAFLDDLEATKARMDEIMALLSDAEVALIQAEGAVLVAEDAVASLDSRIRLLNAEIEGTRFEQQQTLGMIREQAVEMYMNASPGLDTVLFGSEDLKAGAIRLEYSRNVVQDTEVLLLSLELLERQELNRQDRLRQEQQREQQLLADLEARVAEAGQYREAVEAAREELRQELSRQEALLAQVTAEIADHERQVAALEAESRRIELEILRRQVREGRAPGKLAWPVSGTITSPWGMRIHPILGGNRMHTGIDIGAPTGQPIHAAANGLVIFVETWGGYGRTVVLDHGGGLSSLYAHQSGVAVSVGDEVLAGDVIGYIGCTGYCTGPHLHFEVREAGAPVDPMLYLAA